jgi:hypothetical protein
VEMDESIGCGKWQRAEQNGVDDREDRRGGAHAERERQNGDRREARAFGEEAQREADVLDGTHAR